MSGRHLFLIVLLFLLVSLGLYSRYALGRYRVGLMLARVEGISLQAASAGRLSRGLLQSNLRTLDKAEALGPAEVVVRIQRAGQYVLMGSQEAAVRAYKDALALEQRAEIYRNLGQVQWDHGKRDEAKENFQRAVWLDHTLIRPLAKYLPLNRRTVGGTLILFEDFEAGRFGRHGFGRKTLIMKDGFEPNQAARGFPMAGREIMEKKKLKGDRQPAKQDPAGEGS